MIAIIQTILTEKDQMQYYKEHTKLYEVSCRFFRLKEFVIILSLKLLFFLLAVESVMKLSGLSRLVSHLKFDWLVEV